MPTARLAALVGAAALALLAWKGAAWWVLWALVGGAFALGLLDVFLSPSPRRVEVDRDLPAGSTVGQQAVVQWTVRNRDARPLRVTVADQLWPSFQASRRRFTATLPSYSQLSQTATITPERRGRFPVEEIVVRVESVLGLVARQQVRQDPAVLRVFPAFKSKREAELRLRRAQLLDVGLRSVRGKGSGTEFEQLREYTPDDDVRRIDWAATARSSRPIVRTYRPERNQTIVVLLDNGRLMAGTVQGVPRVEHAMDAVMGLTTVASYVGDRLGMVAFDRQVRTVVVPSSGPTQVSRITEGMYRLEPALAESAYMGVFTYVASRFRRRTLFVVCTDLVEAAVEESIIPAIPVLGRQHVIVVAAVRDPLLDDWIAGRHGDALDAEQVGSAYREAAAVAAVEQRRRAAARLRAAGAIVIDANPDKLATNLIDTYLALKSSGRL